MLEVTTPLPPLAFQDYTVDLNLRIHRNNEGRYGAELWCGCHPVRMDIDKTPDDLADLNGEVQEAVQALALDAAGGSAAQSAAKHLRSLAKLGHYAFRWVFGHGETAAELQACLASRSLSLQVVSEDFFLPWELLYPDNPRAPSYENFLGLRHVVSRLIVQTSRKWAFVSPAISVTDQPKLGLLVYDALPGVARSERAFFERLASEGRITLRKLRALKDDPELWPEEIEQFRDFWKESLNLAHLACHAVYKDGAPSNSHLLLSEKFPVSLQDLEVYSFTIDGHPLVVLNACRTGTVNPLYTSHFAAAFLRLGARGVVATECEVPDTFAAAFVEQLYEHLLAWHRLGESMLAARRYFLDKQGDPSGLLYSMYASPSIRLTRPGAPAAGASA
jgi:hypothetical protein